MQLNRCPSWVNAHILQGMQRGIEREMLRVSQDGVLAQTPHPKALGSALTHPYITTDFSESLLELITPPQPDIPHVLGALSQLHVEVSKHLPANEWLWPLSMPGIVGCQDEQIPLAQYGSSNIGRLKTLYRKGLGLRYGRKMQTIAGVHYNLSFGDDLFDFWQQHVAGQNTMSLRQFKDEKYLALIRNFVRVSPLVIYLLGASPALSACFVSGRKHPLLPWGQYSMYLPYATAIRMGDLGYQNNAQSELGIHYNNLNDYIAGLSKAVKTPYPPFSVLGVDDGNRQPQQINDHVLQIENEYYSMIRPKQVAQSGESPVAALQHRGIAYVELRAVDVDPTSPIGIDAEGAAFLETLALACMFSDSPPLYYGEEKRIAANQSRIVTEGRMPNLTLRFNDGDKLFSQWMLRQLDVLTHYATLLDEAYASQLYSQAILKMIQRVHHPESTLSAQVVHGVKNQNEYVEFGKYLAQQHANQLQQFAAQWPQPLQDDFTLLASQSFVQQKQIEQDDKVAFYEYIKPYRSVTVAN